jgi:hypothetical protein
MKKRHGLLFSFAVLLTAAIFSFSLAGCKSEDDDNGGGGGCPNPNGRCWHNSSSDYSFRGEASCKLAYVTAPSANVSSQTGFSVEQYKWFIAF